MNIEKCEKFIPPIQQLANIELLEQGTTLTSLIWIEHEQIQTN